MSPARKLALVIAAPFALFLVGSWLNDPQIFMKLMLSLRPAVLVPLLLINQTISAVLIVELLRVNLLRAEGWRDKEHFTAVGVVWFACSVISLVLVCLGRTMLNGRTP